MLKDTDYFTSTVDEYLDNTRDAIIQDLEAKWAVAVVTLKAQFVKNYFANRGQTIRPPIEDITVVGHQRRNLSAPRSQIENMSTGSRVRLPIIGDGESYAKAISNLIQQIQRKFGGEFKYITYITDHNENQIIVTRVS